MSLRGLDALSSQKQSPCGKEVASQSTLAMIFIDFVKVVTIHLSGDDIIKTIHVQLFVIKLEILSLLLILI
jgi:hypothetical protein